NGSGGPSDQRLLQKLAELREARVDRAAVIVIARAGVVERAAADRTEPLAIGSAEELRGQRERKRVVGPGPERELDAVDVRALELLVAARRLGDLAAV